MLVPWYLADSLNDRDVKKFVYTVRLKKQSMVIRGWRVIHKNFRHGKEQIYLIGFDLSTGQKVSIAALHAHVKECQRQAYEKIAVLGGS